MKNQKLLPVVLCFLIIAAAVVLFSMRKNSDIEIAISESKDEWVLFASFPTKHADRAHSYIKSQLRMTDLTDLRYVEIKRYETPDRKMRFHITSRPGSIEIVMDREQNSHEAYEKLRKAAEGLKSVLIE